MKQKTAISPFLPRTRTEQIKPNCPFVFINTNNKNQTSKKCNKLQNIIIHLKKKREEIPEIRVLFRPHFKLVQKILKLLINTIREVVSSSSFPSKLKRPEVFTYERRK